MKTQVCIIGGGPSGLMLAQLLVSRASTPSFWKNTAAPMCWVESGPACWNMALPI